MRNYNIIAGFDVECKNLLMCRRRKEPFKGLLNFVSGKIEEGEEGLAAAYRELMEETSVSREDITLRHMMDFTYYIYDCCVEVYVGCLKRHIDVSGDENELLWVGLNENFFDINRYAGKGNIGHIVESILSSREMLLS